MSSVSFFGPHASFAASPVTTLDAEIARQKFDVAGSGDDMRVRSYVMPFKDVFVRIHPKMRDKFDLTDTYKLCVTPVEGERVDGYEMLQRAEDLPEGAYLFVVKARGDVVVFSMVQDGPELGSRHSVMVDSLQDEVCSAGELLKFDDGRVAFNLVSKTFGEPLRALDPALKKHTESYFASIFERSRVTAYDGILPFPMGIKWRAFEKACAGMETFGTKTSAHALDTHGNSACELSRRMPKNYRLNSTFRCFKIDRYVGHAHNVAFKLLHEENTTFHTDEVDVVEHIRAFLTQLAFDDDPNRAAFLKTLDMTPEDCAREHTIPVTTATVLLATMQKAANGKTRWNAGVKGCGTEDAFQTLGTSVLEYVRPDETVIQRAESVLRERDAAVAARAVVARKADA